MYPIIFFGMEATYHYFQDYVESLVRSATDMGLPCTVTMWTPTSTIKEGRVHIFIQGLPPGVTISPSMVRWVAVLNTEQLTRSEWRQAMTKLHEAGIAVLDYSLENIRLMGNITNHYHVPYQDDGSPWLEKTEGVCLVSARSSLRRARVFSELVDATDIGGFGKARDDSLFRHKILVNAHWDDHYNVHEHMRTDRCVHQGMIVITEPSVETDRLPLRRHMIVEDRGKIPARVRHVLRHYAEVHDELFTGFDRKGRQEKNQKRWREVWDYLQTRAKKE